MRNWKLTVLPLIAILLGCSPKVVEVPSEPIHVSWPSPLEKCEYKFSFKAQDDKPVVVLPYSEWVKLTSCREREVNYILNLSSMVCYYRTDLKETRCLNKETINDSEKPNSNRTDRKS